MNRSKYSSAATSPNHITPSPKAVHIPGSAHLAASTAAWTNRNREHSESASPGDGGKLSVEGALGRWVATRHPESSLPGSPAGPPFFHTARGVSRKNSFGGDSDAGSAWHGRDDSCAASCWQGINISDDGSSSVQGDGSPAARDWTRSVGDWTRSTGSIDSRLNIAHSEWGGLSETQDSGVNASRFGNSMASSCFYSRDSPGHRAQDPLAPFEDEGGEEAPPSPGRMTGDGSVRNASRSRYEGSHHGRGSERLEEEDHGDAMTRWNGSRPPSPARRSPNHARSTHS